jgi:hypothetical protein
MLKSEAIEFLQRNQPMPPDEEWSEDSRRLDEVREYFVLNPDPACIPLFLGVFGEGSGFGVYQRIEDVIRRFDASVVVPHLRHSLGAGTRSVRFWNAQIAAVVPDASLIPPLEKLLHEGDPDLRDAAVLALGQISEEPAPQILEGLLRNESIDEQTRDLIREMLVDRNRAR